MVQSVRDQGHREQGTGNTTTHPDWGRWTDVGKGWPRSDARSSPASCDRGDCRLGRVAPRPGRRHGPSRRSSARRGGAPGDIFGSPVAVSGEDARVRRPVPRLVPRRRVRASRRSRAPGSRSAQLVASDGAVGDLFGASVAIRVRRSWWGRPAMEDQQGAVYVVQAGNMAAGRQTARASPRRTRPGSTVASVRRSPGRDRAPTSPSSSARSTASNRAPPSSYAFEAGSLGRHGGTPRARLGP